MPSFGVFLKVFSLIFIILLSSIATWKKIEVCLSDDFSMCHIQSGVKKQWDFQENFANRNASTKLCPTQKKKHNIGY